MAHAVRRSFIGPALALAALAGAGGAGAQNVPEATIREDQLAPQWNEQGARVAVCPAFRVAPRVEHFVSWGWLIVEFDVLTEAEAEVKEYDNPASPTGRTRLGGSRVSAAVRRSSAKLAPTVALRYIAERAAVNDGQVSVQSSDPLDGRPGRAALEKGRRLFAIAFPDPYAQGELGVAAVFEHEDQLLGAIDQAGQPVASFDALADVLRERQAQAEALTPADPRQQ
jgi:hypothetical protein